MLYVRQFFMCILDTGMKRVAINGFGRIGRAYFRSAHMCGDIEIAAINDLTDCDTSAYLLRYDTVYRTFDADVSADGDTLNVGTVKIPYLSVKNPAELPWRAMDIDVVIEATGVLASYEKAYLHIVAGASHVIITAPVTDTAPEQVPAATVLMGVNSDQARSCTITSNASCTTNSVAIPLNVMDKTVGVESAILNTIHGYTATQQLVDGPTKKKSNLRYGRAAAMNIVPASTGAALATTKAVTALENRFDGIALRVPTVTGSVADLTMVTKKDVTVQEVNTILESHSDPLFSTTREPIVSSDIIGEPYVSIADLSMTRVVNGNLVKLLLWYDNEMGYARSLIEHTRKSV